MLQLLFFVFFVAPAMWGLFLYWLLSASQSRPRDAPPPPAEPAPAPPKPVVGPGASAKDRWVNFALLFGVASVVGWAWVVSTYHWATGQNDRLDIVIGGALVVPFFVWLAWAMLRDAVSPPRPPPTPASRPVLPSNVYTPPSAVFAPIAPATTPAHPLVWFVLTLTVAWLVFASCVSTSAH